MVETANWCDTIGGKARNKAHVDGCERPEASWKR